MILAALLAISRESSAGQTAHVRTVDVRPPGTPDPCPIHLARLRAFLEP